MKKPRGKYSLKYSELLAEAKELTKLQPDGGYNEEELIVNLETLVTIDIDAEKRHLAKSIVDSETKPGTTEPTGQLHLPGFGSYEYEPYRLIRDNDGHLIEQDKSTSKYKFAESSRAAKHSREAAQWADRKREEAEGYADWVIKKQKEGRTENLTFGDYIRESGLFED